MPDVPLAAFPRDPSALYIVDNYKLTLQKNEVCLDNNVLSQLFIYDDTILNKCDHYKDFEILK